MNNLLGNTIGRLIAAIDRLALSIVAVTDDDTHLAATSTHVAIKIGPFYLP